MNRLYFDGNWHSYIEVTHEILTQNKIDARTPVRITARIGQDSGYATSFTETYGAYLAFRLGGQTKYLYFESLDLNGNSRHLGTLEFLVQHDENGDADGTLTIWSGDTRYITFSGLYWGGLLHDIQIAIPHINRSGMIESVSPNAELGKPVTVTIKDREEGLEHQVWWKAFGGDWVDLGKKADKVFTFTPSRELHKNAGSSDTGKLDICVRTFKDGKQFGGDTYKEGIPIKIPKDIVPTIGTLKLKDNHTNRELENLSVILQHSSDIEYEITDSPKSLTEPVEWHVSINGKHYTGKKGTIGRFNKTGTFFVKAWVVDKRGRESIPTSKPITVSEYQAPQLSFVARRSGTRKNTVTVTTTAKIMPLKAVTSKQTNSFSLEFYTRRIEDTQFIKNEGASLKSTSTYELIEHSANLNGSFDTGQSYMIKAVLRDSFQEVEYLFPLSTEQVVASYSQWGMGIGKVWEKGTLDVAGDVYVGGYLAISGNQHSIRVTGDANNITRSGLFYGERLTNTPTNTGYLTVHSHTDNDRYVSQTFVPFNASEMHIRVKNNGTWSQWTQVGGSKQNTWYKATLKNGWQHHTDYGEVIYLKTNDGVVFLNGTCKGGKTAYETVIFTLPEGYRPTTSAFKMALNNSYGIAIIAIYPSGNVVVKSNVDDKWLNLDNVTFKI